jgi:TPR repeat protein
MRLRYRAAVFAALLWCAAPTPVVAGMEEARTAYGRGDYATALREFRSLADKGNATAQFSIGVMYAFGRGIAKNHEDALRWYRRAAEQGHVKAQLNLGIMYEKGYSRHHGYDAAMKWYRAAAEQGNAAAQYNLGMMYVRGRGVLQDFVRAYMWFDIAAMQGNAIARRHRERVERLMSPEEVAKAAKLARAWKPAQ